jgi:hypothetical protein
MELLNIFTLISASLLVKFSLAGEICRFKEKFV